MFPSCIDTDKAGQFVIMRDGYTAFADGNECASMIISYFEYWHNHKLAEVNKNQLMWELGEIDYCFQESDLYQSQSLKQIEVGIRGFFKYATISSAIDLLIDKGCLKIVQESNHVKNQSRVYLFIPEVINSFLHLQFSRPSKIEGTKTLNLRPLPLEKDSKGKGDTTDVVSPVMLVRRKKVVVEPAEPPLFPSKDVEDCFNHWNTLDPLQRHKPDPSTKMFQHSILAIEKALHNYTKEQIILAMTDYRKVLLHPNTWVNLTGIGHKVPLFEFFKFTKRTEDAMLTARIPLTIESWFDESLKGYEHLESEFGTYEKDYNPKVTEAIKKAYQSHIADRSFSVSEINCFIRASKFVLEYHSKNINKINWNSCPNEKDSVAAFSKRLITAIIEDCQDIMMVEPTWLCSPRTINSRFPKYMVKHGLISGENRNAAPIKPDAKFIMKGYDPGYRPGEIE